jgi:PAS domain S-box-containing protein
MSVPLLTAGLVILSLIVAGQYLLARRAKRTEAELRQEIREARRRAEGLRSLLEYAPFEVLLKDSKGRYVEVSRSWQEYYGITNEEAAGKTPQELFGDDFGDRLSARDRRALSGGRAIETDDAVPHPDGTTHLFHTTTFPIPGEHEKVAGLGMISTDITERKRTEQALRESEEQLRTITDNLPVLIVRWDREQRYRFANKPAEQWYGHDIRSVRRESP